MIATQRTAPAVSAGLIAVLDAVLYLDRKQVVDVRGVRLHPSEAHLLACAVDGMTFTEIAGHFAISKGAVSQTFARLARRGVVAVTRDPARRNAASVRLTPLGEELLAQVRALREHLAERLGAHLAGYSAAELATVHRFVADLDAFVRDTLLAHAAAPPSPPSRRTPPDGGGR